jgi:hypothetical protein
MADDPDDGSFTAANPPSATLVEDDDLQEFGWPPYDELLPNLVPDPENIFPQLGDNKDDAQWVTPETDDTEDVLDDLPNPSDFPAPNHDEQYTVGRRTNRIQDHLEQNENGRTANEERDLDSRIYTIIAPGPPALGATPHVDGIQPVTGGHGPHVEVPVSPFPRGQTAIHSFSSAYDARSSQPSTWCCKDHPQPLVFPTAARSKYVMP